MLWFLINVRFINLGKNKPFKSLVPMYNAKYHYKKKVFLILSEEFLSRAALQEMYKKFTRRLLFS